MKKIWKKALAYLLVVTMCFNSVNVPVYAQENVKTEEGTADGTTDGVDENEWDQVTTENIFEGENYRVTFTLTSYWDVGYNAKVKLENTGDSTIQNWCLGFDYNNSITNIWNAEISSNNEVEYVIKNVGWNQDIAAGNSIEFGLSGDHAFRGFPQNYELIGTSTEVTEDDYVIQYDVENDWGTGFYGSISITNNGDAAIEDWVLEFDFDREITEIWNGVIEEHEGNHYVVRNAEYNSTIAPGGSVSIGIKGCEFVGMTEPENYLLRQIGYGTEDGINKDNTFDETFKVTFNIPDNMFQYEGFEGYVVADKIDKFEGTISIDVSKIKSIELNVLSGLVNVPQNVVTFENGVWEMDEPQLLIGDNILTVTALAKNGDTAQYSTHIWNSSEENMNMLSVDKNDDDKDGLENYREAQYGTNPNDADTDKDDFSDIDELFLLNTDPLVYNSDCDYDGDGLFNKEELEYNTNINYSDTDYDGLTDYDEVRTYGTDPKLADTDRDKIADKIELKWGLNPCESNLNDEGNVHITHEMPMSDSNNVQAMLEITTLPEQVQSLEIVNIPEDDAVLSNQIPGYLGNGCAYDFTLDGSFASAKLTYTFSDEILTVENFVPAIYYYNEETTLLEELENSVWDGTSISVDLEHFSKYIVLNKTIYDDVWKYNLRYDATGEARESMDVVFVIDSSGSMKTNDALDIRKKVAKEFIDKLSINDRAAVVDFDSRNYFHSRFTNDKEQLYAAVDKVDNSGGTNLNAGVWGGLFLFYGSTYDGKCKQKCIIMLTDGEGPYNDTHTATAKSEGVTIYTVGLGDNISTKILTDIAEGTGGRFFHASEAEELYGIYDTLVEMTELYKDSDQDGITDYHEKAMASGMLRLGTGIPLTRMNYLDNDSDDDTIIDGKEIKIRQNGVMVYAELYSNPTEADTDNDGLDDAKESEAIATNIGTHKLSPLMGDTDGDGVSDKEELGTYHDKLKYYRVKSNPFMKEDFSLGNESPVSFIFRNVVNEPLWTKEKYSEGIMPNGKSYTIYTFTDTSTFNFTQRKLVEVVEGYEIEYYLLFADTGNTARGGQGDEIYRKAIYQASSGRLVTESSFLEVGLNAKFAKEEKPFLGVDSDPDNFLYYDSSKGKFLTIDEWKTVHFEERFNLNCCYDKYLPITSYEAVNMGFEKLPMDKSKYHIPDGVETETEKGATHKYIRRDGLEAIYEVLVDAVSVEDITNNYQGTKMLPLQEYPKIGPTYNYAPNDDALTSDASIAHYYFDMIPFYWWGGVRD